MSNRTLTLTWLLALIAIFCITYLATHIFVTRVMADFQPYPELRYDGSLSNSPVLSSLEVKPNYGLQTDQYTTIQPAKNVQEQ